MSRLSTLALYLTLCTKLVTSQTEETIALTREEFLCATDPAIYVQECIDACNQNQFNNQACCAANPNNSNACSEACKADPYNYQACCAADNDNHEACCDAGDIGACCDADEEFVGFDRKKAGCCYKALTDGDSATVCLVTPIDSAELKKQQNSAPC